MRQFLFLAFLFQVFILFSQRVSFNDPDLSFSFKKPSKWELVDDGFNISMYPKKPVEEIQQINITYFEAASEESFDTVPLNKIIEFRQELLEVNKPAYKLIGSIKKSDHKDSELYTCTYSFKLEKRTAINRTFYFMRFNQRFELTCSASTIETLNEMDQVIEKIIDTLVVNMK
ncbi:hypothetical protein [Ekhidna sp.]|uniref:hypothetical protein n=1 Tax=Ekhidna sp. TaxID=2608089 RepID=UPI003B5AD87F